MSKAEPKPQDACEHAKKRKHLGYCAACMIRLYRDEAVKRGAIILRQRKKMEQLRKALVVAARGTSHVHVPTCSGNNESYNGPKGPTYCYQCNANLTLLRQIREALKPLKALRD